MEKQFRSALPSHIDTHKFLRACVTAVQNTPDLQQAQYESIIASCQKAAADGLIIDNREAALVVFNSKAANGQWVKTAQYMPMLNGILKKARQSGEISTISAHVVYQNDTFEYWVDEEGTHFKHRPELMGDRGDRVLAYAVAKLKDGSTQLEVLTKEDIEKVRGVSKSGSDKKTGAPIGIWAQWPDQMWKKTALRALCKLLPSSTDKESDLYQTLEADNENYDLGDGDAIDITPSRDDVQEDDAPKETRAAAAIKAKAKPKTTGDDDISEGEIIEHDEMNPPPPGDDDIPL